MGVGWIKVPGFTVVIVGLFVWAGDVVDRASGGTSAGALGEGVSVENGEQIFWGPGKCSTCHSIGSTGSSVRGPNLGQSTVGAEIAVRAVGRAGERATALGREMTGTDYLIESVANPSAYVVDGFKDEMPKVYEPPIALGPDQVASVILYLQSIGGVPDPSAVVLPPEIREAAGRLSGVEPWEPYLDGDSLQGRELFFDQEGSASCVKCHTVEGEGGDVGPELTGVAGTRTAQFIVESILRPSSEIASGYETVLIQTSGGRLLDGVILRERGDTVWLGTTEGEELVLPVADIARRRVQELSIMPADFSEVLSVEEFHDLLAYLRTLR